MTEYWTNGIATLYQADARQIPLPDQSVHCCVTSPPYFGLRVYRSDSAAMIGLEETVQGWLDSMLAVMAEVGRVLRDDGVLWVNLGDSYGGYHGNTKAPMEQATSNKPGYNENYRQSMANGQLLGIPWRFALAMQDAGWILRSDVIWAKKSCMPESLNGTRWERCRVATGNRQASNVPSGWKTGEGTHGDGGKVGHHENKGISEMMDCPGCPKCADTDGLVLRNGSWRCTSSHEHIFQFVKKMNYWSDGEAVKTASDASSPFWSTHPQGQNQVSRTSRLNGANEAAPNTWLKDLPPMSGANRRNVWSDISPEPYGGEHYATFPSDLPRICIQASTSEAGVCGACGNQWARDMSYKSDYNDSYEDVQSVREESTPDGVPQSHQYEGWATDNLPHLRGDSGEVTPGSQHRTVQSSLSTPSLPKQGGASSETKRIPEGGREGEIQRIPQELAENGEGQTDQAVTCAEVPADREGENQQQDTLRPKESTSNRSQGRLHESALDSDYQGSEEQVRVLRQGVLGEETTDDRPHHPTEQGRDARRNQHSRSVPKLQLNQGGTLGWRPTCTCQAAKVPATVLDCFAGTGTTLLAAMRLGRRSVGTDLSADYLQQAVKRLSGQNMPMEF